METPGLIISVGVVFRLTRTGSISVTQGDILLSPYYFITMTIFRAVRLSLMSILNGESVDSSSSGLSNANLNNSAHENLDLIRNYGYLNANLDPLGRLPNMKDERVERLNSPEAQKLKSIYCQSIGLESLHITDLKAKNWLHAELETGSFKTPDKEFLLKRLAEAELFEKFLHTRYVGAKRFSLEGLGSLIPLLDSIVTNLAANGGEVGFIGMAHRGRLTTLWTVLGAEPKKVFACFEDVDPHSVFGAGDVKYHRGAVGDYKTSDGKSVRLHLASNPSHLEIINPVVMGRTKAYQDRIGKGGDKKAFAILIHGDAAFAGQGVTAECLNLAGVNGFDIGGVIHINANNLIGFTAPFNSCHASPFSTDVAKRIPVPIVHVCAEDVQAVWKVGELAAKFRQTFSRDFVIDLIGYRRFGHNEGDDPTFTSPALYSKIEKLAPTYVNFAKSIGKSDSDVKTIEQTITDQLTAERDAAQQMTAQPQFFSDAPYWEGYFGGEYKPEFEVPTGVSKEVLTKITEHVTTPPNDFTVHPKLQKLLEQRKEMGLGKKAIDWGMAEQLAFGSLLIEGHPVRIAGQDSRRATFNQRHAVFYDYKTNAEAIPLANIGSGAFQVYDSILSEAGVMGFEYGYSRGTPEGLVCWEAQFGDFVNGAQIVIDQFLSAAEDKWKLLSGLVLLLPHGFEGQGPEHSSARLERFLQLCGEDNMQVVQPSNSAQYFHLLRRQTKRKWRKPLIVMTPKSMLRLPAAGSQLVEFETGSFQNVIPDLLPPEKITKVILCSGKIVHDLRAEREKRGLTDTAILTLEQLYPFPEHELEDVLSAYTGMKNLVWVQEEPANMGALSFVRPYLDQLADRGKVSTVRRSTSASPATGSYKAHDMEQKALIHLAFASSN